MHIVIGVDESHSSQQPLRIGGAVLENLDSPIHRMDSPSYSLEVSTSRVAVIVPTRNAGLKWADFIAALQSQMVSGTALNPLGLTAPTASATLLTPNGSPTSGSAGTNTPGTNALGTRSADFCSSLEIDVTIVDSSSSDRTVAMAKSAGFEVLVIDPASFDHSGTRQMAFEHVLQKSNQGLHYNYMVFMTQDAILSHPNALGNLLAAFNNPQVGAAYGRQLPHSGAHVLASHARAFNYPEFSSVKSLRDKERLGIKTAFCSNSFAAYRVDALEEIGGFPQRLILGEDMWVAAKMLERGLYVSYVSEACVYHSHNYTLLEEFKRYFDTGVFHAEEPWILKSLGSPQGEGGRFVRSELKLLTHGPWPQRAQLLFEIPIRTALKYLGYLAGKNHAHLPLPLKRRMGMFKAYWDQ
jgi:rhamnosyltransferase